MSVAVQPSPAPRVSIVLPVRNAVVTLPAALASLAAQTEPNWELLVVNDGSTDGTADLLEAAARQDRRIRVFHTAAVGIVSALNLGLEQARSALIARHDADDVAHAERLERQCAFLDCRPEIGLVSCLVDFGGVNEANAGYRRHVDWINGQRRPEEIRRARFIESPLAHPSVLFRRDLVAAHGGYVDGAFPEDYELWLRWLDAGVKMSKVEEKLLTWMDGPHRLSRVCPRYSIEAFYRVKARYLARWLRRELPVDRPVWIWGAGRVTRTRVRWLLDEGIQPAGWIDIDRNKIGGTHANRPVCAPEVLLTGRRPFVLAYVGTWEAREIIAAWLQRHGFAEESDYFLCA